MAEPTILALLNFCMLDFCLFSSETEATTAVDSSFVKVFCLINEGCSDEANEISVRKQFNRYAVYIREVVHLARAAKKQVRTTTPPFIPCQSIAFWYPRKRGLCLNL